MTGDVGVGRGAGAPVAAAVAVAVGCGLLMARPLLVAVTPAPTTVLVSLFAVLLAVGWAWPGHARAMRSLGTAATVLVVGVGAFAVGRLLAGGRAPVPPTGRFVVLNTLAAVAEEAFFRRLTYDVLLPGGDALAVGGSALLFALVHVTVYGAWVLPVDLAAGLLLGWQRWASGSWPVPALTHVLANVLVVI